jgi:polysaccharide biosynthesis/export protein
MWALRLAVLMMVLIALPGCSTLPGSGPLSQDISQNAAAIIPAGGENSGLDYAVVNLSRGVLEAYSGSTVATLAGAFGSGADRPQGGRLGVGDELQVTIFESQAGGLFIPTEAGSRPGNYVNLPTQRVDTNGKISVPYAGAIQVAGRTTSQVENSIQARLKDRAIEPQVVVSVISQRSESVSVIGEVNASAKIPIDTAGNRVLEMISKAGGIRDLGHETWVAIQRGNQQVAAPFDELVRNPQANVYVKPGDIVYVSKRETTFVAFGASGTSGKFSFGAENLSMAEAIGRAQGLNDSRADPQNVFLYRIESRATLQRMGVDLTRFNAGDTMMPVIYRANLRGPAGFFIAQHFMMQDKDIIYVSNSPATEIVKFLQMVRAVPDTAAGVAYDARVVLN